MNRKPIFFTADLHIGHANSIKFDNRPFRDLEHMHDSVKNNFNTTVPKDGICYFLGDVGFGNKVFLKQFIASLNGTKVLVLGNHDPNYTSAYNVGFDVVVNSISLYICGSRVTMSHCPLRGVFREDVSGMSNVIVGENWHGESRHHQHSVTDEGQYHLHGHIHSSKHNGKKRIDGRQFDVGMPANHYRPVSLSEIESWITKHKQGVVK